MRVLCVAEKPSISKAITQILSGGQYETKNTPCKYIKNYEFDYHQTRSFFTVTAVLGHLTSNDFFATHRQWHSCDPFELFDAPIETQVAPDKKDIERNLTSEARRSDVLMIWTDCDREGEHIGMEIARVCRQAKPSIRVKRARFSAIIAQQIHNAAQNPVELDRRQADAVEARIMLDLKVGAAFTRLQTLTLQGRVPEIEREKSVVSYGPCQFPTLGFVVQRYQHVKNFSPETFWYIYLSLSRPGSEEETKFTWRRNHLFDEAAVAALFAMIGNSSAVVTKVTNKTTKKWKPLPLTTVELQKAGSRLLRLAPKKVLDVAEALYTSGFVSYPRTETDEFDPQFDHMSLISKQTVDPAWGQFATALSQGGYNAPRKGKHNDKAHPPIHPTAHANNLTGDQKRVYEYITRRYLACCSKDAEGWQTTVDVACGGEEFSATGLIVKERNYLDVYVYEKWNGHHVPDFREGEEFQPTTCEIRQGETTRPNYLTEADLVTLMDKNGIGTDATIAQHIETIVKRNYVIERFEGAVKYLVPSTLGIGLVEGYNMIGLTKSVSKPQMRRETERRMVQVCEGTTTKNDMLAHSLDQYKEMFIIVRREFAKVTDSVTRYLAGPGGGPNNQGGGNGPGPAGGGGRGGGGGAGDHDDGSDGGGGGGGGARGGRGSRGARGTARGQPASRAARGNAPAGRGRGRGGAPASAAIISIDDSDDNDDFGSGLSRTAATRPASTKSQTMPAFASSSSSTAVASSSRQSAPLHITSSWSATTMTPAPSNGNRSTGGAVQCECNIPAVQRTVVRETASKGRQFWTCSQSDCGFFQWADDTPGGGGSSSSSNSSSVPQKRAYSMTRDTSSRDGPARKCGCGEDAILLTVQKESENKGRKFWKCQRKDAPCEFFEWDDKPPKVGTFGSGGGGMPSRTSSLNTNNAGASDVCYKCNQSGHWANSCPNGDGPDTKRARSFGTNSNDRNPAGSSDVCYKCNQSGHWATSCPNGDNSSNARSRSFTNNSSNDKAAGATCFKCQRPGHYSTSCPDAASGSDSKSKFTGQDSSGNACFKCGDTGHWSSKCPSGSTGSGGSKRSYSSGGSKRGRGGSSTRAKRGRGGGSKKKSTFAAADDY